MQRDAAPRTSAALRTDLAVLFLSAVCVIFSFRGDEGAVALQPSWAHAYDAPALRADNPLPAPVVADLDDDGAPEVLVATRDGRLLLLGGAGDAAVAAAAAARAGRRLPRWRCAPRRACARTPGSRRAGGRSRCRRACCASAPAGAAAARRRRRHRGLDRPRV